MIDAEPLLWRLVEAMLFASAEPVSERELVARLPQGANLEAVLSELEAHYCDRGVRLLKMGNAWAFRTAADLGPFLARERQIQRKLSRAAIETLAIIAYHQPITRAEIEGVRGVQLSKGTLDVLFESGWIGPKGKRNTPGRPVTWGTTTAFLDHFALGSLDDLPGLDDLKAAGLLDARPAVEAYGATGAADRSLDAIGDEGGHCS
jgi:segregation and condensation protein B